MTKRVKYVSSVILVIFSVIFALVFNNIISVKNSKYRLGNEIDLWFTGNLISRAYLLFDSKVDGFVKYLHNNPPNSKKIRVGYNGPTALLSYSYMSLYNHLPVFRTNLYNAVVKFFANKEIFYTPKQCVIHYRLGDFLLNKKYGVTMVTPKQIVDQVVLLKPKSVLLLDGGLNFKGAETTFRNVDNAKKRGNLIKQEVRKRLTDNNIHFEESTRSADDDFATMVFADYLVTGLGSYAITAAIANIHGKIRTPALKCLNPNDMKPHEEQSIPCSTIINNWTTYHAISL